MERHILENNQYRLSIPVKAGLELRALAFVVDFTILTLILAVPFAVLSYQELQEDTPQLLAMIPVLFLEIFLLFSLKDIFGGQSPGKRMMGIAVRKKSVFDEIPSLGELFLRNILMIVWPVELLYLICSKNEIKFGDRIAGTEVYIISKKVNICLVVAMMILTAAIMLTLFVAAVLYGASAVIQNSKSYQEAIEYIENNPELLEEAGDIEGYGFIPKANISVVNGAGQASYSIKVVGSNRTLHAYVGLEKEPNRDWEVVYFEYGD